MNWKQAVEKANKLNNFPKNKIDCSIRKKLQNMYLDFKNNYLTISHFAENNNLDCYRAVKILKHGYAVHEKQFKRR